MFKNTAQKLTVFAFADAGHASLDAGEPVTGDAANITCKVEQDDDGTRTAVADTNPTETEDGQYVFDVTAAECNGDKLTWYPESATAGVQVVAWPSSVIYTRPENYANFESALTNYSATRGLAGTALPAAAADAAGGIPISDAGGLDLDARLDAAISSRSSHSAADVWTNGTRTLSAFSFEVTVGTNNDKTGYGLSASERTSTAAAIEAAIINELDGQAVMQAIADLIADDMTTGDLSVAAIATATRDLILGGDQTPLIAASGVVTANMASLLGQPIDNGMTVTPAQFQGAFRQLFDSSATDINNIGTISSSVSQTETDVGNIDGNVTDALADTNELQTKLIPMLEADGSGGYQFTALAVENVSATVSGQVTVGAFAASAILQLVQDDTGETSAGAGSHAKLSQGSGGGSGTVVVLPSAAVVPDRSDKKKLQLFTGETITQSISIYEYDETTAVDLTGESLEVVFETEDGTDITVVASGDITIGGASNNVVSFATPAAVTNRQRVCLYAIRRESDGYVFGHGNAVVTRVAGADA